MIKSLKKCGINDKMERAEDAIFFDNDINSNEEMFSRDCENNVDDFRFHQNIKFNEKIPCKRIVKSI